MNGRSVTLQRGAPKALCDFGQRSATKSSIGLCWGMDAYRNPYHVYLILGGSDVKNKCL